MCCAMLCRAVLRPRCKAAGQVLSCHVTCAGFARGLLASADRSVCLCECCVSRITVCLLRTCSCVLVPPTDGARVFVVVDTNVLMSFMAGLEKTFEAYASAAASGAR